MANPIVVGIDGYSIGGAIHGSILDGIWFYGIPGINGKVQSIQAGSGATIKNCVFINLPEAIDGIKNSIVQDCIFINCGWGTLSHSIYYNDTSSSSDLLQNCIFIGGQGYHMHLYHSPSNVSAHGNFSASALYSLALQGDGNDLYNNFFWSSTNVTCGFFGGNSTFHNNYFGRDVHPTGSPPPEVYDNIFYNGSTSFGTNPTIDTWNNFTIKTGYTFDQIDNVVYYLNNARTFTPQQLLADTSINTNSAIIKDMMVKLLA